MTIPDVDLTDSDLADAVCDAIARATADVKAQVAALDAQTATVLALVESGQPSTELALVADIAEPSTELAPPVDTAGVSAGSLAWSECAAEPEPRSFYGRRVTAVLVATLTLALLGIGLGGDHLWQEENQPTLPASHALVVAAPPASAPSPAKAAGAPIPAVPPDAFDIPQADAYVPPAPLYCNEEDGCIFPADEKYLQALSQDDIIWAPQTLIAMGRAACGKLQTYSFDETVQDVYHTTDLNLFQSQDVVSAAQVYYCPPN
jgi:hypothetical protein